MAMTRQRLRDIIVLSAIAAVILFGIVFSYISWDPEFLLFDNRTEKLIKAIQAEDLEKVTEILEDGLDPNLLDVPPSLFTVLGETYCRRPINEACKTGNIDIVKVLIEYGANAEYNPASDWSPLYLTIRWYNTNDVEMVKILLENGADPKHNVDNDSNLFVAANMSPKNYDLQPEIWDFYNQEAAEGITEIVKILLGNNDINEQNHNGDTILIYAAKNGNLPLVEYLLSEGASIYIKNNKGETALSTALERPYDEYAKDLKYDEIIELLTSET